jgi:hypothetical protein
MYVVFLLSRTLIFTTKDPQNLLRFAPLWLYFHEKVLHLSSSRTHIWGPMNCRKIRLTCNAFQMSYSSYRDGNQAAAAAAAAAAGFSWRLKGLILRQKRVHSPLAPLKAAATTIEKIGSSYLMTTKRPPIGQQREYR